MGEKSDPEVSPESDKHDNPVDLLLNWFDRKSKEAKTDGK